MHCVLSSQDDHIVVISRIQARFSACFMKLSWVQLKFLWAYCFLQKKERHCPFMFGEKGWRAETQTTSGFISWLDEKMPFCFSWGNVIIPTVIGEPKAVSWAEECVLLEDGLENHQQDGSFKEKRIDHFKKNPLKCLFTKLQCNSFALKAWLLSRSCQLTVHCNI